MKNKYIMLLKMIKSILVLKKVIFNYMKAFILILNLFLVLKNLKIESIYYNNFILLINII